jgi:hypothetical protein
LWWIVGVINFVRMDSRHLDALRRAIAEIDQTGEDYFLDSRDIEMLPPITTLSDGEGGVIEIHADGSYVTKHDSELQ